MLFITLYILSTYRLTVLLVNDVGPWSIIDRFRFVILKWTGVFRCAHCVGVWMALVSYLLGTYCHTALIVLAIAGGQSFLESCMEKKFNVQ